MVSRRLLPMPLLPALLAACTAPTAKDTPGLHDTSGDTSTDTSGDTSTDTSGDTSTDTSDSAPPDSDDTWGDTGVPPGGLPLPDLAGKSLVYIHVDTFRFDHLPQDGYARNTLPNLSERDWLVVDGIYGGSSWTMPSTAALLTATPPDVNGLTDDGSSAGTLFLSLRVPTVTEHLSSLGFATGVFTGNSWLTDLTDMDKGFDLSVNIPKDTTGYNLDALLGRAVPWMEAVPPDQPFFLLLQPMNMHLPYWVDEADKGTFRTGTPPWDEDEPDQQVQGQQIEDALRADPEAVTRMINDVYDEEMIGLDRAIDGLLDGLEASGRLASTVVILTADHGEVLNDAGDAQVGHGQWLREELIHVPFLVLLPGGESGAVDCIAPNQDVFPTLLDAMGLPPLDGVNGVSVREGCHPFAVSTLWWNPDTIKSLTASNGRERLERSCDDHVEVGYDLVNDPAQLVARPPTALAAGSAMHDELERAVERVMERYPKTDCAVAP